MLEFEWDDAKAESNLRKHGVSFDDAAAAFNDEHSVEIGREVSLAGEVRITIVALSSLRILAVVHSERGRRIRIISARKANRYEQNLYAQNRPQ